jgi:hypothetical protein
MDLTIPYTFYPIALPHWIAWSLFAFALLCGVTIGVAKTRKEDWLSGVRAGLVGTAGFILATMVASMVITFFVHDQ